MATKKKKKKSNPGQEAYNAQVQQINASYDSLIDEQKQYNTEFTAGNKVEGLVSGRTRYAPVIQNANIQNVVNTGLSKVQKLVNEKNSLLANARAAKDKYDAEMLDKELKAAQDAQDAAAKEAQQALENAYKEKEESRKQATFEQEQAETLATNVAPSLAALLTGNKDKDEEITTAIAAQNNLDPLVLSKAVQTYKFDQQDKQMKNMPTLVKEYQYATSNGFFNGGFLEYQKLRAGLNKSAPKTKVLDLKTAVKLGIPELAGVAEDELVYDLIDPNPPQWWIDIEFGGNTLPVAPGYIQKKWDEFRNDPTISNFTKGINKDTNILDLLGNIQALGISDYNPDEE